MDEKNEGPFGKDEIRSTREMGNMGFERKTPAFEKRLHPLLRSRVTSLNTPHAGQSLLACHDVAHKDSLPPRYPGRP